MISIEKIRSTTIPIETVQTWDDGAAYRGASKGNFILEGIQHPEDALRPLEYGADGITVSNHDGRQFDSAAGTFATLPKSGSALASEWLVMADAGIRSGSDAVVALALGARCAFTGRCTLYGVAAYGEPGCVRAVEIIRDGIMNTLVQIGCPQVGKLDQGFVVSRLS